MYSRYCSGGSPAWVSVEIRTYLSVMSFVPVRDKGQPTVDVADRTDQRRPVSGGPGGPREGNGFEHGQIDDRHGRQVAQDQLAFDPLDGLRAADLIDADELRRSVEARAVEVRQELEPE